MSDPGGAGGGGPDAGGGGSAGAAHGRDADARVDSVFAALADPTRRDVVAHLAEAAATATELAGHLPVSRQAVAKHLAVLRDAALVEGSRQGREARYRLTPAPFTEAMAWMAEVGGEWDRRLERLRALLEEPPSPEEPEGPPGP